MKLCASRLVNMIRKIQNLVPSISVISTIVRRLVISWSMWHKSLSSSSIWEIHPLSLTHVILKTGIFSLTSKGTLYREITVELGHWIPMELGKRDSSIYYTMPIVYNLCDPYATVPDPSTPTPHPSVHWHFTIQLDHWSLGYLYVLITNFISQFNLHVYSEFT